jgi:Tat protein secretion system quality control protein TatD with DNase activity
MLKRAWEVGVKKIIITGTHLEDSKKALELARSHGKKKSVHLMMMIGRKEDLLLFSNHTISQEASWS